MNLEKILVIQIKQLGDVLMCTPAIRSLKQKYPQCVIHVLTQSPSHQIFAQNQHVDKVLLFPPGNPMLATMQLAYALYKEHYDGVIDFYNKPISAVLTWLSRSPLRLGYNRKGRSWAYTEKVSPKPNSLYSADERIALLAPLKISSIDLSLDFPVVKTDRQAAKRILSQLGYDPSRPLITLSPVSRRAYRIWPPEKFAQAANRILAHTHGQLLLLWGPGEKRFIEPLRRHLTHADMGDYEPPTLAEMVAIFELTDFHFGNDNGPMHMAISAHCPTLTIIGQSQLNNWVPPQSDRHFGVEHDPGCKQNCTWPQCKVECLDVSVDQVVSKALDILQSTSKT